MHQFFSVEDVQDPLKFAFEAIELKRTSTFKSSGAGKTIGLLFFNSSLRTRLSMQKAAFDLNMNPIILNVQGDSWQLEFEEGVVMDGAKAEHIKDAVRVVSSYCDIIGVRSFAGLQDRNWDYSETVLKSIMKYSTVPVINMESATLHPLQSLADLITILEYKRVEKPKIVMTWAPHVRSLPQAVGNSFAQWILTAGMNLTIAAPKGFELSNQFTEGATITNNQTEALQDADFVYVKNWSSFKDYGAVGEMKDWMLTEKRLKITNSAKIMHCLPVRRNLVISDELLDGEDSLIYEQAENRVHASKKVIHSILSEM